MITYIRNTVVVTLRTIAEERLTEESRNPYQLSRSVGKWTTPGGYVSGVEESLAQEWFGDAALMDGGVVKLDYLMVPRAAIQAVFETAKKSYDRRIKNKEGAREEVMEAYKGMCIRPSHADHS